jgi:hypothetical protein
VRASAIAYWAAKEGSSDDEYEDAWGVVPDVGEEIPGNSVTVTVTDGATESLLAKQWAGMIADKFSFVTDPIRDAYSFAEAAVSLTASWPAVVDSYIAQREKDSKPLRWYERPGIAKGAFATLLTLQVNIGDEHQGGQGPGTGADTLPTIGSWFSAALGDTCLFHVSDGSLRTAFPLTESAQFGTSPALLGSFNTDPQVIVEHVRLAMGSVAEGDDFFVCTDALAAWFLSRTEEGNRPWETLRDLADIDFAQWASQERQANGLRNDDVTLVHIDIW